MSDCAIPQSLLPKYCLMVLLQIRSAMPSISQELYLSPGSFALDFDETTTLSDTNPLNGDQTV